jgi:glyoxylase-like metal-dependent hydrolase (beta-lactamase superfamily II)
MSNYISVKFRYYSLDPSFRIYPIRGLGVAFHLLYDATRNEAVLIDTGLFGEVPSLHRTLNEIGLTWRDIKAILLTHGHLDHAGNLARLRQLTGAPILAHPFEQTHLDGTFPYRGPSRLCGAMEAVGRLVFRYRPVPIDQPLEPGMELPYWGGLKVVHLPGHTEGHCGFYSRRFDLLFSGDFFASYWFSTHLPPIFLNSCPEKFEASLQQVKELSPRYIIPNHYDGFDGELHRRKFDLLYQRHGR